MDKRAEGYLLANPKQDTIDRIHTPTIDTSSSIAYFSGYVDFPEIEPEKRLEEGRAREIGCFCRRGLKAFCWRFVLLCFTEKQVMELPNVDYNHESQNIFD